jgi:hypothetical protein
MVGSMQVDADVDDDFASISRIRAPNCNSVISGGVDLGEKVMVEDVDGPDMIGCFLETIDGITRELCSLLLRTCSNEIEVDRTGRTICGGKAGKPMPDDPRQNIIERIHNMNISNKFVTDAMQEVSDKSICLTGNALGIAEELLNPFVGHLHEVVLVEPANILRKKMR